MEFTIQKTDSGWQVTQFWSKALSINRKSFKTRREAEQWIQDNKPRRLEDTPVLYKTIRMEPYNLLEDEE